MTIDWSLYLEPGERMIWQGAPRPGMQRWKIVLYAVGSLLFLSMGMFMLSEGLGFRAKGIGVFFDIALSATGLLFVLGFFYMVFGLWLRDAKRHNRCRYGLSDRRAYIADGEAVSAIPLTGHAVDLTEFGDGSGTLYFGFRDKLNRWTHRASFDGIDDVVRVRAMIEKVAQRD